MSLQIIQDLLSELTTGSMFSSGTVFYRNPIQQQSGPYIVFTRNIPSRNMVSETDVFQIVAFNEDTNDLEEMVEKIITHFEDRRVMGSNHYYSIALLNVTDGRTKLDSGHYWTTLSYQISSST